MKDVTQEYFDQVFEKMFNENFEFTTNERKYDMSIGVAKSILGKMRFHEAESVSDIRSNYAKLRRSMGPLSGLSPRAFLFVLNYITRTVRDASSSLSSDSKSPEDKTLEKDYFLDYTSLKRDLIGERNYLHYNYTFGEMYGIYLRKVRKLVEHPYFVAYELEVADNSGGSIEGIFIDEDRYIFEKIQFSQMPVLKSITRPKKEQIEDAMKAKDNDLFSIAFQALDPEYVILPRKTKMKSHGVSMSTGQSVCGLPYGKRGHKLNLNSISLGEGGGGERLYTDMPFPVISS